MLAEEAQFSRLGLSEEILSYRYKRPQRRPRESSIDLKFIVTVTLTS